MNVSLRARMTDLTRLHSSRMRTARALTVSPSMLCLGVSAPGGCTWSQGCLLWGEGTWSGGCLLQGGGLCSCAGCLLLEDVPAPGGVSAPRGCLLRGECTWSWGGARYHPPVNRMTNRCKNITLFAGGKNSAPLMSQTYS